MSDHASPPLAVLVVGAGPAALEGALALQRLAHDRVEITLVAPEPSFVYRPLAVAEPFGLGQAVRFSLEGLARERGFRLVTDAVAAVDTGRRQIALAGGDTLDYDALLLAVGAEPREALPGALMFRGPQDVDALRSALAALRVATPARVAFVATRHTAWTLPIYELALMTARWAQERDLQIEPWLVTYESRASSAFGPEAATTVAELLELTGVRLWTGAEAEVVEDGRLWMSMEGGIPIALAVALPRPVGRRIPGLPADELGFVPVDAYGHVAGAPDVYAAGDMTTRPLRQGGLAALQADAAASAIAARAGAAVSPDPYRPRLRAMLLTGERPRYLTHAPGDAGETWDEPPWWPPHKIAGRHLGPYLAAHPELRRGAAVHS
jgi:sulfide:quinone oxidoreductase